MIATDLDGTLLGSGGQPSQRNLDALRRLGERRAVRVIATGRSAFSARRVVAPEAPIDYLVVSSGAGIIDWRTGEYLRTVDLVPEQTATAATALTALGLDFMVHDTIPDNHRFVYRRAVGQPDFERRIALYVDHCTEGDGPWTRAACQLLAVHDGPTSMVGPVRRRLPEFSVVRATSPLDRTSEWIEVFDPAVSKSQACAWIADRHALSPADALAVGNDTNDLDLLRWAGQARVVANAHEALLDEFDAVAGVDAHGFAEAAEVLLGPVHAT